MDHTDKFRILLVDDEPLILAGIKFMVDWNRHDCVIVGTASNGGQAFEMIYELIPDIVIADINMPVLNGIDLMRRVSELYPQIVFIMLTNLEEFEMAQQALRYKAIDYVTKSQLEPETLEKSLGSAIAESQRRKKLSNANLVNHYIHSYHKKILRQAVLEYLVEETLAPEYAQTLKDEDLLAQYGVMHLWLEAAESEETARDLSDSPELVRWQVELIEKLCKNSFSQHIVVQNDTAQSLYVLYNADESAGTEALSDFFSRLESSSQSITGLSPCLQATSILSGMSSRAECRRQLQLMREYAYFTSGRMVIYSRMPAFEPVPPDYGDISAKLQIACNTRNGDACMKLLERTKTLLTETQHKLKHAQKLCVALYAIAEQTLQEWPSEAAEPLVGLLHDSVQPAEVYKRYNRSALFAWLDSFFTVLCEVIRPLSQQQNDTVATAKAYAKAHISKKISLQDAAKHVRMSPNYFSTYFKKKTGMNFIDYANRLKIEHACGMIAQGGYRINEIASELGFENAYYFSKVFRRYKGISPSEYQQNCQDAAEKA